MRGQYDNAVENQGTAKRLLIKSKESFMLAVEIYNRPSLRYHAEACSMLLCNAWELMLKAHLINTEGERSIYYKDNPSKTISLSDCLKKVFSNEKDPVRINMSQLIKFRNTNTHFITEEYEIFYGPFLQAGVNNYGEKLHELHGEDLTDLIPQDHLALTVQRNEVNPEEIRAKYEPQVAEKLLKRYAELDDTVGVAGNAKIAAIYDVRFSLVKKANDADLKVKVDKNSETSVAILREVKDAARYYPYTASGCIKAVNSVLGRTKIKLLRNGEEVETFNQYHFQLFCQVYLFKSNRDYGYDRKVSNESKSSWIYSQRAVDLIVGELKKDPEKCLDVLKARIDADKRK